MARVTRCRSTAAAGGEAVIDRSRDAPYAWEAWTLEWASPAPGEHTITSRATDTAGKMSPR